jgi:aminoglycoside phosphotransferase (APT) family kinase protein
VPAAVAPGLRRWLAAAVAPDRPTIGPPLPGATTSTAYPVTLDPRRELVLRAYDRPHIVTEWPGICGHEAETLRVLADSAVPAPALVAVDSDGSAAGIPALLMERLPGAVEPNPEGWLTTAAEALTAVHRVTPSPNIRPYRPYNRQPDLPSPPWLADPGLWDDALGSVPDTADLGATVFIHRDYHPGNLLWNGATLGGIVDWANASMGPPQIDIAHFRLNLWLDWSAQAADEFLAACQAVGVDAADQARWDLRDAIDGLPYYAGMDAVAAWTGWCSDRARSNYESYLRESLRRL